MNQTEAIEHIDALDKHPVVVSQKIVELKRMEIARNWQGSLTTSMSYQLAKLSVAYGLDPFLGELICLGNKPYPTAAALQRKANEDPRFEGEVCRPATKEERDSFYYPATPPEDEHLWKCEVYVKGKKHPFEGWGRASSKNVQMKTMQIWLPEMAQKRARARAYRLIFNIGVPTIEEMYEFEDGSFMPVKSERAVEMANDDLIDLVKMKILTEENKGHGYILPDEWKGMEVALAEGMTKGRAVKILEHFLGPEMDGNGGILKARNSQNN